MFVMVIIFEFKLVKESSTTCRIIVDVLWVFKMRASMRLTTSLILENLLLSAWVKLKRHWFLNFASSWKMPPWKHPRLLLWSKKCVPNHSCQIDRCLKWFLYSSYLGHPFSFFFMWMALTDVDTLWSFKDLLLCIDDEDYAEDEKPKDDKWFKRDCKCCGRTKPSTLSFNCEKFALISECKFVNRSLTPGKIESILIKRQYRSRKDATE